jgi:hypothetical protein
MATETFAPWISDPDDPADTPTMTIEDCERAAANVARAYPELIDKSMDGPLKPASK